MDGTSQACYKYSVTIGTPDKILEHLLETRILTKDDDILGFWYDISQKMYIFFKTLLLSI